MRKQPQDVESQLAQLMMGCSNPATKSESY